MTEKKLATPLVCRQPKDLLAIPVQRNLFNVVHNVGFRHAVVNARLVYC